MELNVIGDEKFVAQVWQIVNDKRGWPIEFKEGKNGFTIILTDPEEIKKKCGFSGLSCALGKNTILIHRTNWNRGTPAHTLKDYRTYVINHELGHLLGLNHQKPTGKGLCPVMVQQTISVGTQKSNVWPLKSERLAVFKKHCGK